MGKFSEKISEAHQEFILKQHMFFVGTAPLSPEGRINVSPKGLDSFRILNENKVAYMDIIGSGNESSAHTSENGRITIMFCSFDPVPNILRLYGKGYSVLPDTTQWAEYAPYFEIYASTRQIIVADIDLVQTSCGFGVPLYDFQGYRDLHFTWADQKGPKGLEAYIETNNLKSLDGLSTAISLNRK